MVSADRADGGGRENLQAESVVGAREAARCNSYRVPRFPERSPGRSLFSYLDENECRMKEFQEVAEAGPLTLGSALSIEYGRTSVIRVSDVYYISSYHKYNSEAVATLTFIVIKKRYDGHGNVEFCNFQ